MNEYEKKIKHIELIQNIISRIASNSFQLKVIFVTLLSVFVLFFAGTDIIKKNKDILVMLLIVLNFSFWILDSYYLFLERGFRNLYNSTIKGENRWNNVSEFELKIIIKNSSKVLNGYVTTNIWRCLFSVSTSLFYFPIFLALLLVFVFLR